MRLQEALTRHMRKQLYLTSIKLFSRPSEPILCCSLKNQLSPMRQFFSPYRQTIPEVFCSLLATHRLFADGNVE